jgi:hypothetical protein
MAQWENRTPIGVHITPPVLFVKRGTTPRSIKPFSRVAGPHIRNAPELLGTGRHVWDTMSSKTGSSPRGSETTSGLSHLSSFLLIMQASQHAYCCMRPQASSTSQHFLHGGIGGRYFRPLTHLL